MNLFGVMDVSGSALKAERVRAEVVAANMANAETTRTEDGGPYQRQHVIFEATGGAGSFQQSLLSRMGSVTTSNMFGSQTSADSVAGGVAVTGVIADQSAPLRRFDPQHPDAGPDGYVEYPDINPLTEMVDLMGATRAYGMNASAVQAEKGMFTASLDLLK
jgi:flagellar basal-body rod protein FlgC